MKNYHLVHGQNFMGIKVSQGITQWDTKIERPLRGWSRFGSYVSRKILFLVDIHISNNFENTINHIIESGRRLTNFFIGNNINAPNELNYAWKTLYFMYTKLCNFVSRHVVTTINRYSKPFMPIPTTKLYFSMAHHSNCNQN